MEKQTITITIEKAREWYHGKNEELREIALQAFDEKDLIFNFKSIKTFEDACKVLDLNYDKMVLIVNSMNPISKASAAMFQLNIVRQALNFGKDLHLTKDPEDSHIYFPHNPIMTKSCTYYKNEIDSGEMSIIGKIINEGEEYYVLGGYAVLSTDDGLSSFSYGWGIGTSYGTIGFLGCVSKEIAKHFGKYFGMLITEAKYGDLSDFRIIENN